MIEWAWTLLVTAGLTAQVLLVREALLVGRAAKLLGANGDVESLIHSHVRSGLAYCVIHVAFLAAGISAIVEPDDEVPLTPERLLRIVLFMGAAVALVAVGWADYRERRGRAAAHGVSKAPAGTEAGEG